MSRPSNRHFTTPENNPVVVHEEHYPHMRLCAIYNPFVKAEQFFYERKVDHRFLWWRWSTWRDCGWSSLNLKATLSSFNEERGRGFCVLSSQKSLLRKEVDHNARVID